MDLPSKTIVDVLSFLLPGFVTASLLYSLTPKPRPIPFERLVQALIFTIVVKEVVDGFALGLDCLGSRFGHIGSWTDQVRLLWSFLVAVALGAVLAWNDNSDRLHALLRRLGVTHQTSFSSEWFGTLSQAQGYVVLHLVGQRRLYGWPVEWPNTPEQGHFVMGEAEWLPGEAGGPSTKLVGVHRVLIPVRDVEMVELMEAITADSAVEGETNGRS